MRILNPKSLHEKLRQAADSASAPVVAAVVASLQDFRDMFSSEMLPPEETFSIQNPGFLFTDLRGSTETYEPLGDAQAIALVKEHVYVMERLVRGHGGAIVKTIGWTHQGFGVNSCRTDP